MDILKPLTVNDFSVKDSFSFVNEILSIKSAPYMCSFDVVSLFTNIPLDQTINICIRKLFECNDTVCNLSREQLRELLMFATKQNHFTFNGKYYDQVNGVAMGSPLGPIFTNIYMVHLEINVYQQYPGILPLLYKRYVDDTFLIFNSKEDSDAFF